jgi:hypothetical protein
MFHTRAVDDDEEDEEEDDERAEGAGSEATSIEKRAASSEILRSQSERFPEMASS